MNGALSDEEFELVRAHLERSAGLLFDQSRRPGLSAVVVQRMREADCSTVGEYLFHLGRPAGAREQQGLLDAVTVQETQFFRNLPQIEALRRRVLPELLRGVGARGRPLTIWSAGCSTGEEAYTLAMLLLELSPGLGPRDVRILATDVSAEALRTADRGVYAGRSVAATPALVRDRWFERAPGGALAVKPEVRSLVHLQLHNLVTEPPPFNLGEVDLLVCRNVTIYFGRDTTRLLVGRFHDVLAASGYLLLGHSETLWQVSDAFELLPVADAFFYRPATRRGPAAARPAGLAAAPAPTPRRVPAGSAVPAGIPDAAASDAAGPAAAGARRTAAPEEGRGRHPLRAARAALASGDYAGAVLAAEGAVRAEPLGAPAYVVLGHALSTMGRDGDALAPLRKAVYLDPRAGHAHFLLAGALARLGQPGPAALSYRAAAGSLASTRTDALEEILDGREVGELVDLCRTLAEGCANAARSGERTAEGSRP